MQPVPSIPEDTFQSARRMYNIQHCYLRIGDQMESLLPTTNLALLDPSGSFSSDMTLRLAMVTCFQYAEALPDRIASEASLRRLDWKYALRLPTAHPGLPSGLFCHFRRNLFSCPQGLLAFGVLAGQLVGLGLVLRPTDASLDPLHILTTICRITRLHRLNLAMKLALSVLSSIYPDWMKTVMRPHWYARYKTGRLYQSTNIDFADPITEANALGADIRRLLAALDQAGLSDLSALPEVQRLAHLLNEQFQQDGEGIHWLKPGGGSCTCHDDGEMS